MFDKLRLKLTLINVGVTALLFIILIAGVYILLHFNSLRATEYFLNRITDKVITNQITDLPSRINTEQEKDLPKFLPPPPRPNFFFIKADAAGNPFMHSSGITVAAEEIGALVRTVQEEPQDMGRIKYKNSFFAFKKTRVPNTDHWLFVLNDLSDELAATKTLLTNLVYVGLFCMLLSFIASFFMAKQAIRPIQRALTQQKNFVSDASHELRTPITVIQANLDILNGASPGDTLDNNRKWLDNIQGETTRMTELINSLLFLARADAKRQLLEKEYFSLNQAVFDVIMPLQVLAKSRSLALTADISGNLTILGDPARIRQALTILIDNALRHTPAHGEIIVSACRQGDVFLLRVADTGEGIAAKHLDKIFDRFYQVDDSRNQGGAGLGLSMAKWIVEQHRGAIAAASAPGKGCVMTIRLPVPEKNKLEKT